MYTTKDFVTFMETVDETSKSVAKLGISYAKFTQVLKLSGIITSYSTDFEISEGRIYNQDIEICFAYSHHRFERISSFVKAVLADEKVQRLELSGHQEYNGFFVEHIQFYYGKSIGIKAAVDLYFNEKDLTGFQVQKRFQHVAPVVGSMYLTLKKDG